MNTDLINLDDTDNKINNIYRYKFTDNFTNDLYEFSKIHQYDDRKVFKEAWNIWVEDNKDIVDTETRRLTNMKYEGDVLDKMFKSARYYFRKKSTEKKEPQKRCVYTGVKKELLVAIDAHIIKNITDKEYKPSIGFLSFCKENLDIINDEESNLVRNGFADNEKIQNKIKKTYKNRYFMLISK
jgi:hypothetical protein